MFTGIVEHVGKVVRVDPAGAGAVLRVEAGPVVEGVKPGDSISVDGACLTVVGIRGAELAFDVSAETLRVATIASCKPGAEVNLERALRVGDRLGGHFVLGHVDCVGKIAGLRRAPGAITLTVSADESTIAQIVSKGSVAVSGISLTVASRDQASFSVAIIPHTWENTSLRTRKEGDAVNLELDIIGKYVAQFASSRAGGKISKNFLAEHGFT